MLKHIKTTLDYMGIMSRGAIYLCSTAFVAIYCPCDRLVCRAGGTLESCGVRAGGCRLNWRQSWCECGAGAGSSHLEVVNHAPLTPCELFSISMKHINGTTVIGAGLYIYARNILSWANSSDVNDITEPTPVREIYVCHWPYVLANLAKFLFNVSVD